MSAPVVTSVVTEDLFGVSATFTGSFDSSTQETGVRKIDASTFTTLVPGVTAPDLSIESIEWTCSGVGVVNLYFDATTPLLGLAMRGESFRHVNGAPLKNTARGTTGYTGDFKFTTTGFVNTDTYVVTMRLRKDAGFTFHPIVASNLCTDAFSGTYLTGDVMEFTVVTDQTVFSDSANSGMVVAQTDGTFVVPYSSGSGTKSLILQHTMTADDHAEAGDLTLEHILGIRGSSIGAQQIYDTLVVVDTSLFTINAAATSTVVACTDGHAGVYVTGNLLRVQVTFSKNVVVTGVPTVSLTITSGDKTALYVGYGADHTKLLFDYHIVVGDVANTSGFDITGDIGMTGATIRNEDAIVDAVVTLAASNTASFKINHA